MAKYIRYYDSATGRLGHSTKTTDDISGGPPTIENYDAEGGGQTMFQLASDITLTTKMLVYRNGELMREGGSYDWTRDAVNDQITFNYTLYSSWVSVVMWV